MLFRVISANRLRHFTLAILHGACINSCDPRCKLLSLYPVQSIRKFTFKDGKCLKSKPDGARQDKFEIGLFCRVEFPETFKSLEQAIHNDKTIMKVISDSRLRAKLHAPNYERNPLLRVAYTTRKHRPNLIKHAFKAALAQNPQELESCGVRAASLDGCLLSTIGRKAKSVGVVFAINNTLGPLGGSLLVEVPGAMKKVICHFVRSVVVAGLPSGEIKTVMHYHLHYHHHRQFATLANGYSGLSLYQAVQIQALARAIALISSGWARDVTLTAPFSTQVYTTPSPLATPWVTREFNVGDSRLHVPSTRGVERLLITSLQKPGYTLIFFTLLYTIHC